MGRNEFFTCSLRSILMRPACLSVQQCIFSLLYGHLYCIAMHCIHFSSVHCCCDEARKYTILPVFISFLIIVISAIQSHVTMEAEKNMFCGNTLCMLSIRRRMLNCYPVRRLYLWQLPQILYSMSYN